MGTFLTSLDSRLTPVDCMHADGYDARLMILLALEQSTRVGSVALLRGETLLAERQWESEWSDSRPLFSALPAILAEAGVAPQDVEALAVGLGPGSFSGVRATLSAARAFALPGNRPVRGISSGEALAAAMFTESGARRVVVVGDARRNHVWHGTFERSRTGGGVTATRPWALAPFESIATVFVPPAVVVSPDWDRIGVRLKAACPAGCTLVEEFRAPAAQTVGRLAAQAVIDGRPELPLEPLYLHPPVFVEPRF